MIYSLLPYQSRWVMDKSRLKVCEKSRRIGLSWAEAYDSVLHAGTAGGGNVYYQSYSQDMTRGFINDCSAWARGLQIGADAVGETLIREGDKDVQAFRISLATGKEILAMTSAPRAFRSKGGPGDVGIIDEAAFVDDLDEVIKAAMAFRVWGGAVRIISTHNGESNKFAEICRDIKNESKPGTVHTIKFADAIADGLCRRIFRVTDQPWTAEAQTGWIAEIRAEYGRHAGEELDCVPAAGSGAWLTWENLRALEDNNTNRPEMTGSGPVFIGVDVARRHDLWVAWVLERVGDVLWTRELVVEHNIRFSQQRAIVKRLVDQYRPVRVAVDQTGMGEGLVEQLQDDHGSLRVEGVLLTAPRRLDVATALREAAEDFRLRIPSDNDIRQDLHSIRSVGGGTGAPRLWADTGSIDGHADRFWALALACAAASDGRAEYGYRPASELDNGRSDVDRFMMMGRAGFGRGRGQGAY